MSEISFETILPGNFGNIYGPIPKVPTLTTPQGIKFDFCHGLRMQMPKDGQYHVTFIDQDTGSILYQDNVQPGAFVTSTKKYYVRYRLEIRPKGGDTLLYSHDFDLAGKEVMVQMPVGTLGDCIAWFSNLNRFQRRHKCRLIVVAQPFFIELVSRNYPQMIFITKDETVGHSPYACYYLGIFFGGDTDYQPIDYRQTGLHTQASNILGMMDSQSIPPTLDRTAKRVIKEKYVCIAVQASSQCKVWNNPDGWDGVVAFLKENGYRVLCIDKYPCYGRGIVWNKIPREAEDFTGNKPLQERVNLLKDADFFIGGPSGLSWLAWASNVPVVLISGFSLPYAEFPTPYRVINYHACTGCWNDMRENYDHSDYLWCPRHKGTDRHFECSRLISAQQVINTIRDVYTFRPKE